MRFVKLGHGHRTTVVFLVIALVILGGAGYFWWKEVYTRPENVFSRMLVNSLSTTSVTKQSVIENGPQHVRQTTRLQTAPDARVHGLVEITQEGEQSSLVRRETIATTTDNFVRLVSVETNQKNSTGQPYDFSSVLGVWGQTAAAEGDNSLSQLYGQNVAVPYAHLSANGRRELLGQIRRDNVYQVNYGTVQSAVVNGRKTYAYEVSVKPEAFINMMKAVGKQVGVRGFDEVDPSAYKNLPDVKFTFIIDVISGDLVSVDYGNGQVEEYAGNGMRGGSRDPNNAIPMSELQQRLQSLQR